MISFALGAALAGLVAVGLAHVCQATAASADRPPGTNAEFLRGMSPSVIPRPNTVVVRNRRGRIVGARPGPSGPAGPAGPQGPPGISGYQVIQQLDVTSKNWQVRTVSCPAGKVAIGGGAEALGQFAVLNRTGPAVSPDGSSWSGWVAVGHSETPGASRIGLSLWVACAMVS
jgi:hypothetical protein